MSVRELSTEALTQAIHSPGDDGFTMDRARQCLRLYRAFDMDPGPVQAQTLESYAKALRTIPRWAVAKGFDDFERDGEGNPTPPKIVKLARNAVQRLSDELSHRQRLAAPVEPEVERTDDERLAAQRAMAAAGYTPKRLDDVRRHRMASTDAEMQAADEAPTPHWSETVAPDSPEMEALRKARDENPLVQEARRMQAAREAKRKASA